MKELSGTARNYHYNESEDHKLVSLVELILVLSEPEYHLSLDDLIRERVSSSVRFATNLRGIKSLLKTLLEVEKELEDMEKRHKE